MEADLSKDPDYSSVISALIEKTEAKKLNWTPTASDQTYIAALGGVQTFKISRERVNIITRSDRPPQELVKLTVNGGPEGKTMFTVSRNYDEAGFSSELVAKAFGINESMSRKSELGRLFDLAQRVADRIDQNVIDTLNNLTNL